eukprot:15457772-Alexandrium_andersonii.AAC.1
MQAPPLPPPPYPRGDMVLAWVPASRVNVAWGQQPSPSSARLGWAARGAEVATVAGLAGIPGAIVR